MAVAQAVRRGIRLAQTVRHLRPVQVVDRLRRRAFPPRPDDRPAPETMRPRHVLVPGCPRTRRYLPEGERFRVLNIERGIAGAAAWNDASAPRLWLYNLHYFDDLPDAAGGPHAADHAALIERWIAENPPGQGTGWEPYPISLRIVNWIKWALRGGALSPGARHSLAIQARFLAGSLEYHLLANHLWANAKALLFSGLFFAGDEGRAWRRLGSDVLGKELTEQILPDGGHFELSPMYHAIIAEDLLDLLALFRAFDQPSPPGLDAKAAAALGWLRSMTRPDGHFPLFNDAAYGVAPEPAAIFDYAARLGLSVPPFSPAGVNWLLPSGYACARHPRYALFVDAGPLGPDYNPGHGHCDMLSFDLTVGDRPIIVNGGTSTYDAGPLRSFERSTAAHNTVQVGTAEQSDIWGAFRVGRRARIVDLVRGDAHFEAAHDGFAPLGVTHRRAFDLAADGLVITDRCSGTPRDATARFRIHPDIETHRDGDVLRAGPVALRFEGADRVDVADGHYAPEFNRRLPCKVVEARFRETLITRIAL